tara:strand:+ start:176 stop:760 length:585 start_codon:yes stop_codon:yes gene_type:complete
MSAINIFTVDCSTITCPSGALGAMNAQSADCAAVVQSEVNSIVWWHPTLGTSITNWGSSLATGDFDIDNTDATDVKMKRLFGVGDMPAPEFSSVTVNNFNQVDIAGTWTLNFDIYDVGDLSYDYLRKLECGKVKPQFVFTTVGGKIYGDGDGITATQFRLSPVLERGEESIEKWVLSITWKSQTAPDRVDNPLP